MAINSKALLRPKFGALFTAKEGTSPVALIKNFTLTGEPPEDWTHWGHLSRSTLPAANTEGGDTTTFGTWLMENTESDTADSVESTEYALNQMDALTISGLAALHNQAVAGLELWASGVKRFGIWWPSLKGAWTQRPLAESVDEYAAMKFKFTVQKPSIDLASLADPAKGIAAYPTPSAPTALFFDFTAFELAV
jgi:hypothetical protein